MNKSVRNWLILTALIAVAVLATLWATFTVWFPSYPFRPEPGERAPGLDIQLFYSIEAIVSTINVTLAIFLLATYVSIYEKTKSEFTIGLALFSGIFLLNAIASNPFVILAFGYRPIGLGPFAMLSDLFTLVALAVLLYLSVKY
jgi:magnesium-transporting ATPase (P-type)